MSLSHHASGPRRAPRRGRRRDGGYVLAKFALLLVPLLLMTGLSVDVGYWYNRAADIQKAADAAALAGVVWLPDLELAEEYAIQAAGKNGFFDGQNGVTIDVDQVGDRRLRVSIQDESVGSFLFLSLGGREIEIGRAGQAEYVLPVPLGSPYNFFGLGGLTSSTTGSPLATPTVIYQSVNPSCTSKVNGDRHQSLHYNPLNTTTASLTACTTTPSNLDYRPQGYELYVEAKAGRTANIDVLLYDPRYSDAQHQYQVPGPDVCTTTYTTVPVYDATWTTATAADTVIAGPAEYQTRTSTTGTGATWGATQTLTSGSWFKGGAANLLRYRQAATWNPATPGWTTTTTSSTNLTITGPAVYQTRTGTTGTSANWTVTDTLDTGETYTYPRNRLRYRLRTALSTTTVPTTTCVPGFTTITEPAVDSKRQTGAESFTFSLYAADTTPLTDTDNPLVPGCSKVYAPDTAFEATTPSPYLGTTRWNKLCTITPTMTTGRYIMRVHNGTGGLGADGSNQWGMVAKFANATGDGLCDGRQTTGTGPLCPRVYGKDAISVYANTTSAVAAFFLAEIDAEHNGKTLELELWDPGEGGTKIEILRPNGSGWTPSTFSWTAFNEAGTQVETQATAQPSVDVTGNRFNGRLLRIRIPLTSYAPLATNKWWKIQYTFGTNVTDRTTWSAKVIGDPVHLYEDEAD